MTEPLSTDALRAEFGRAINEVKAQIADKQRLDTIDFTVLDALVAGTQDTADPAWLTATPVLDENGAPVDPDAVVTDPAASTPDQV